MENNEPEAGEYCTVPQSPETSTLPVKLTTAPLESGAVTTMSAGQPSAHVAGGAPAARTSTEASEELLVRLGSLVSLPILAVLEITPLGAPPLTEKSRVIVATVPLAQLGFVPGRLQSTIPPVSVQTKAELVVAGETKVM